MDVDLAQLRALDATVRGGTLEAAARALHVTPSAISQRLRALEAATGRILLVRTKPVQVTESRAPVVVFDRKDDLQHRYLHARAGHDVAPPVHYVPAAADYVAAVTLGMGWGMVPGLQAREVTAELVALDPTAAEDVVLYWQQWKLRSTTLDRVREAVLAAAGRELDRPAQSGHGSGARRRA